MNTEHDRVPAISPLAQGTTLPSATRRRFARAGLAAPVVLSSLASKPVLGAAPYHCTVSGQISGNMSPRADAAQTCRIGASRDSWLMDSNWPSQIVKGTLPNGGCNFAGDSTTIATYTRFNGYQRAGTAALSNVFFNASVSGNCSVTTTSVSDPALRSTMLQVLHNTSTADARFELGRVVVVSLLNSYRSAPNYPVTDATIIAMFNATVSGGVYPVNSSVSWTRDQVITYLKSLYSAT